MTSSSSTSTIQSLAARVAGEKTATLKSFLSALSAEDARQAGKVEHVVPKLPELTDEVRSALAKLPEALAATTVPDTRRQLTEAEEAQLGELVNVVKTIDGYVSKLKTQGVRVAAFNHLDVQLEAAGAVTAETPRDSNGFYLVPGEGSTYKRDVTSGTPSADPTILESLAIEGVISREDYLAATAPTRVIDEKKFLKLVARKPHLLGALRRAVKFSRSGSVSLKLK